MRDATYVLDGLLYHESDIRIEEHYTDTSGFTDHVFALMHLLGFRFAPRIRDLADKRLFVVDSKKEYGSINTMIGDAINVKHIKSHWDEIYVYSAFHMTSPRNCASFTASCSRRKRAYIHVCHVFYDCNLRQNLLQFRGEVI